MFNAANITNLPNFSSKILKKGGEKCIHILCGKITCDCFSKQKLHQPYRSFPALQATELQET